MKARIISVILALAMLFACAPAVMAAKKVDSESQKVNIIPWGAFDSQEMVDRCSPYKNYKATYQKDGKTNGCARIDVTDTWGSIRINCPFPKGETFDMSFDIKADKADKLTVIFTHNDNTYSYLLYDQFTTDWKRISFTWEHNCINSKGVLADPTGMISFRWGDGKTKTTYYVDNLTITPHGNVPADYSSMSSTDGIIHATKDTTTIVPPAEHPSVAFSDVENHWAQETVNTLATYGYVDGVGENCYNPDAEVTRAEFVKMMTDTFRVECPDYDGSYSDVTGEEWFAGYITLAEKLGLLNLSFSAGGTWKPNRPITREEAASVAAKTAQKKQTTKAKQTVSFSDADEISVWAGADVEYAASIGLIKGYDDGTYRPKGNITRAEAAQILMRVAELSTKFHIYVDADNGNDVFDGTKEAPLKTVYAAKEMIRKVNQTMQNDIMVHIRGRHYLNKTFALTPEDSGMNGYRIHYTSWGDEKPTLSMGKQITGFTLHDGELNIYKTYVGVGMVTRQAYFNDVRGIRARSVGGLKNAKRSEDGNYYIAENTEIAKFAHPEELEFVYHIEWCNPRAVLESAVDLGDGTVKLTPVQSQWSYVRVRHDAKSVGKEHDNPSYYENAYELLDQPGEWYMNKTDGYMYYIPRENEDMSSMVLTVPVGEELLTVVGVSPENPVYNITFSNIQFSDAGWLRPTLVGGHADAQNNHIREGANSSGDIMPGSALFMENIRYIDFKNNMVTRMGCTGLETKGAIQHVNIIGNEFFDLSGTAVTLGGIEDAYLVTSEAQYNQYNKVNNNYIHQIGVEYNSAAAISTGWPRHSQINHNEIVSIPYSGMHIAYGWERYASTGTSMYDLEIGYNYIHEVLNDRIFDGAGIYTIGASSLECVNGKNRIINNYFEGIRNGYGSVYLDQGSTYWHVAGNVSDYRDIDGWERNFVEGTFGRDKYYWFTVNTGTGNNLTEGNYATDNKISDKAKQYCEIGDNYEYTDGDWPEEAKEIIKNAGIEPEYRDYFGESGAQSLVALSRTYSISKDNPKKPDLKVYGQNQKEYPIEDFVTRYTSSNPDILTVSEDGTMTAKGSGTVWVEAAAIVDGKEQIKQLKVNAGDKIEKLRISANSLNMLCGYTANLNPVAQTTMGNIIDIPPRYFTVSSSNEQVATVSTDGLVTAVDKGEAVVSISVSYEGFELKQEVPVTIITYSQEDSLTLPYEKAPKGMFTASNWSGTTKVSDGKISVAGSPAFLTGADVGNKLIAFDMSIENPNGWPSLALCAKDSTKTYKTDDCYMIGFKEGFVEVQRFNQGVRTMIFGEANYSPVGGPGIDNTGANKFFHYNTTYSVIVGAFETEKGTRIVLTINGENVFDFLDTDEKALSADGLFGVYNTGTFTFSPFTGITNKTAGQEGA